MVVVIYPCADEIQAVLFETRKEGLRVADAAEGKHRFADQFVHRDRFFVQGQCMFQSMDGFGDGHVWCNVANLIFHCLDLLGIDLITAGDNNCAGTFQCLRRLPQQSCRQDASVAERTGRIHGDNIHIPLEPSVLEAVVQYQDVRLMLGDRFSGTGDTVGVDDDRHIAAGLGQQGRFVGHFAVAGFVAACQDGDLEAFGSQILAQPDDQWGLARSAGGDVADADHRHLDRNRPQHAPVIQPVAHTDDKCV